MKSLEEQVKIIQKVLNTDYKPSKRGDDWAGKQLFDEVSFKLRRFKAKYGKYDLEIDQETRIVIAEYLEKRPELQGETVAYLVKSTQNRWMDYHNRVLFPRDVTSIESMDVDALSHGGYNPEKAVLRKEKGDQEQTIIKEFIKTLKEEDKFFFKKFVLNKVEDLKGEAEKLGFSYEWYNG